MDTHPLWDVVLVPDAIGLRPFLLSMEDANHVLTLSGAATPPQSTSAEGCNACLHPEDRHHQHTCSKRRLITLQTPRRSSSRLRQLGDSNPSHAAGAHASAATLEAGEQLFDALGMADMLFSAVGYGAIEDRSAAQQHDRRSSSRQERSRAASRSRSISPARSWAHEEVAQEEEEGDPAALVSPLSTFTAPGGAGSLMCVSIPPQLLHCNSTRLLVRLCALTHLLMFPHHIGKALAQLRRAQGVPVPSWIPPTPARFAHALASGCELGSVQTLGACLLLRGPWRCGYCVWQCKR